MQSIWECTRWMICIAESSRGRYYIAAALRVTLTVVRTQTTGEVLCLFIAHKVCRERQVEWTTRPRPPKCVGHARTLTYNGRYIARSFCHCEIHEKLRTRYKRTSDKIHRKQWQQTTTVFGLTFHIPHVHR